MCGLLIKLLSPNCKSMARRITCKDELVVEGYYHISTYSQSGKIFSCNVRLQCKTSGANHLHNGGFVCRKCFTNLNSFHNQKQSLLQSLDEVITAIPEPSLCTSVSTGGPIGKHSLVSESSSLPCVKRPQLPVFVE